MKEQKKQLLLKDLSARLPYGVKCHFKYGSVESDITLSCIDNNIARFEYGWYGRFHVNIDVDYIKPYLRPMSSMTDEEKDELYTAMDWYGKIDESGNVYTKGQEKVYRETFYEYTDWLNAHHFDYRGLIEKGLALEAPKGMYNF